MTVSKSPVLLKFRLIKIGQTVEFVLYLSVNNFNMISDPQRPSLIFSSIFRPISLPESAKLKIILGGIRMNGSDSEVNYNNFKTESAAIFDFA